MVGVLFVVLVVAVAGFALGYLFGADAVDAETSVQVEALERAQRINAATFEAMTQMGKTSEASK